MNNLRLSSGLDKIVKHAATIFVGGSFLVGCGSGSGSNDVVTTNTDTSSSTIRVVDGPVKNANVDLVLEDGIRVTIGVTNENGELKLTKELLEELNLDPDKNISIISTGGEDENGPVTVDLKLPVLTVSELEKYVDNNETININPTTTFVNYVQTQTNYDLGEILEKYVGDKNGDGKVDLNDVVLSPYNAADLEQDPNNDGYTILEAVLTNDDNSLNLDLEAIKQAPSIEISVNKTSVEVGEEFILTANASDNGEIVSIKWYDGNNNEVGEGESFSMLADDVGTYTFYAVAEDDDGNIAKSNEVTINVEAIAEVSDVVLTPGEHIGNVNGGNAIEDLGNYNYKVYVDDDTVEGKLTITVKGNEGDDIIEASGYRNDEKTYHSDKYDIDIYIDFEYGGY